jgi:hypothetical protein
MCYGRRRHQRRSAFPLGQSTMGKIFVDQAFIRNCTLQDLSHGGARLLVHGPYDIPEIFDLVLDALGVKKTCRIVWRSRDKMGVEFSSDAQPGTV